MDVSQRKTRWNISERTSQTYPLPNQLKAGYGSKGMRSKTVTYHRLAVRAEKENDTNGLQ